MVFGYLEIILQYTLPGDNVLQHRLNSCHNLVAFCDQIRSLAFPNMRRSMYYESCNTLLFVILSRAHGVFSDEDTRSILERSHCVGMCWCGCDGASCARCESGTVQEDVSMVV